MIRRRSEGAPGITGRRQGNAFQASRARDDPPDTAWRLPLGPRAEGRGPSAGGRGLAPGPPPAPGRMELACDARDAVEAPAAAGQARPPAMIIQRTSARADSTAPVTASGFPRLCPLYARTARMIPPAPEGRPT